MKEKIMEEEQKTDKDKGCYEAIGAGLLCRDMNLKKTLKDEGSLS